LKDLQESLADLEETMQFDLTYSSAHISGNQVSKDEESLRLLREEVARVERFLRSDRLRFLSLFGFKPDNNFCIKGMRYLFQC